MAGHAPLNQLARVLAKNYFDTSQTRYAIASDGVLQGEEARELRETGRQVFTDPDAGELALQRPERIVLVVGAGASFGAFGSAYPGTAAAVRHIYRKAARTRSGDAGGEDGGEDDDTPESTDASPDTEGQFETALSALVEEFGDARIREEMGKLYGERHHPHLGFEIIAHLFKHRFIDAIINFNFDELLDEAIEGEMGTSEYHHVLFEGECQGLAPLLVDRRLKIPLYIKPNGTVSHPSSMRFTREPNARLPEPVRNLIAQVVGGHWVDDRRPEEIHAYKPYRVNLITVGFSMQSASLLEILNTVASGITLYHLNRDRGLAALKEAAKSREWKRIDEKFIDVDEYGGLAETIRRLWNTVGDHFRKPFRPRGIARHEIVHNLFFAGGPDGAAGERVPRRNGGRSKNLDYFRARLSAEVAMAIARGNGQIDLGTLSESRVGTTFDLMRACPGGDTISMHQILEPFCRGGRVEFSGRDNSVFRFQYPQANNAAELNLNMARALWKCLLRALHGIKDPRFQHHMNDLRYNEERAEKMIERFRRLASSDAQDISPTFRHRHLLLSQQPQANDVIHTSLGLTLRFVEMLREPWDLMLAISENGKVIEKYQRHLDSKSITHPLGEKRFCLILARNDHPEVAEERLKRYYPQMLGLSDPPIFYIPAWAHNQHMVLLLSREGGEYRPVSAVRYETPRLGNRVNPVFIRDSQSDLDAALMCFKRYVHLSVHGVPNGHGNSDVEDAVQRKEADVLWEYVIAQRDEPGPTSEPDSAPPVFG